MKALTIRNLPEMVADAISQKAAAEHLSLSKALILMLEEHVTKQKPRSRKKRDLSWMAGTMTQADAKAFDACLRDQRRMDPQMWK